MRKISLMNPAMEPLIAVSLAWSAHVKAEYFRRQQSNPRKAQQVYLNTLAVYAVNFYLQCLGWETDLEASDSWNPLMQRLMDVADIEIPKLGKLECRPVLPDSQLCYIPPSVRDERIGYVAVQLSASLKEATLLGFAPQVTSEKLPLGELRSLEDFPKYLHQIGQPKNLVNLSQWLQDIFDAGWEKIDALLEPQELAFRCRNLHPMQTITPQKPTDEVERGKLLGLGRAGEQVALFVGLKPTQSPEMHICVEVYPINGQTYLPQDLQLMVLDERGEAVMQAQARSTKNIQLKFSGEPGESFGIKVAIGDVSITEPFLI